jgi:hypothetical protein
MKHWTGMPVKKKFPDVLGAVATNPLNGWINQMRSQVSQ